MSSKEEKEILVSEKKRLAFIPTQFIYAMFPLRNTKKEKYVKRYGSSTQISLTITGQDAVPWGSYARILLAFLTTHAVLRQKEDDIIIRFDTIIELLNYLGVSRSKADQVKEQLDNMRKSVIHLEIIDKNKVTLVKHTSLRIISESSFIKNEKNIYEKIQIQIAPEFAQLAKKHSIPIDYDVYKNIHSPLGKDIFVWVNYKNNLLKEDAPEIFISRVLLIEQFGSESAIENERQYFAKIKDEIGKIKTLYPELNLRISDTQQGIFLKKSPDLIKSKDIRYVPMLNYEGN